MGDYPNCTIRYVTIKLSKRTMRLTVREAEQLYDTLRELLYHNLQNSKAKWGVQSPPEVVAESDG